MKRVSVSKNEENVQINCLIIYKIYPIYCRGGGSEEGAQYRREGGSSGD
jgi:hypothetical protein